MRENIYIFTFCLFLALLIPESMKSQTEKYSSYEGMHFQVSFMQNEFYVVNEAIGVELKIFIATRSKTNITVNFPDAQTEKYTLPGDSVLVLNISNFYYNDISEVVRKYAIEILTDVPVVVYAFNSQAHTSDSYVCIPVSNWGDKYAVLSMPNDQYDPTYPPPTKTDSLIQYTPRASEFMLISGYDNTWVTIRPAALTDRGKQVGRYYQILLNKGDTYLVKSYPTPKGYGDLTGTYITSTKPVGVLSGHVRSAIPQNLPPGKDSKDHLVEQLSPMDSWGNLYCSVPFGVNVDGDLFRVMSKEPNTRLKVYTSSFPIEYILPDSLSVRSFSNINVPAIWQSDKPIQMAQFMQRRGIDPESKEFDPSMVLLPPREQFVQQVLFTTPGGVFYNPLQYSGHFVSIVAEESAIQTLKIDGVLVDTISSITPQKIFGTDLHWVVLPLNRGTHHLSASSGKFSGILYGVGEFDSYAMVLGASLIKPDAFDEMAPVINAEVKCFHITGESFDFQTNDATGINFIKIDESKTFNFNWTINPTQPDDSLISFSANVINPSLPGRFVLESFDKAGNKNIYKYDFKPFEITATSAVDFGQMSSTDSLCLDFVIKNTGTADVFLDSINFPIDSRLKFYHNVKIPDTLTSGESITVRVCFNPKGDIAHLNSEVIAYFGCDVKKRILLLAEVVVPALEVKGWDFGNVYVGDSAKHVIYVENIGNVQIRIDSLYFFTQDIHFTYDSLNLLPQWIAPGEKFEVMVTFKPSRRDLFMASLRFANHMKMNNQVYITGKGVAPLFTDYSVDFGKRRIGTSNDTTINIMNDGNILSELSFKEFVVKRQDDFNSQVISNIKNNIDALELLPLNFKYDPVDKTIYNLTAKLKCDWYLHPDILLTITGEGTIPEIQTSNYDFGDVVIFSDNNASPELIESSGNETLRIDYIKILGGDTQSFTLDLEAFEDISVPVGSKVQLPIQFKPSTLGIHTLILGVVNDAMPNYQRKTDTIIITGKAIAPPTLNVEVEIIGDGKYSVCNRDTIYAVFKNKNDFPVDLTDIQLDFIPATVDAISLIDYESLLPIKIEANKEYRLPLQTLLLANEAVTIRVKASFNNSNERETSFEINPKIYSVTILQNDELTASPKDTLKMSLKGNFENPSQVPVKLDLTVFLEKSILYMITQNPVLEIVSGADVKTIPLKFIQETDKIVFTWDAEPIEILPNSLWTLNLDFLTLLFTKSNINVRVEIKNNNCYLGSENQFRTIIQQVCVNDTRQIRIIENEPIINIFPNPVKNILKIDLDLPKNSYFYISLFDIFGKEYILDKNLFLSKGKYLLIYVVENMTNGKYYLQTVINGKVEYKNINIIR